MVASGVASSSLHCPGSISTLGSTRGWSVGILMYHSMSVVLHLGKSPSSGSLGVECIEFSFDISGMLCLSSSCISSSNSFQISGGTCHRSIQTLGSGTMLDRSSLASHISQHAGRHSLVLFCHKRSCHGCFDRPDAQGSAIAAFTPLAAQWYMLCRQEFSS